MDRLPPVVSSGDPCSWVRSAVADPCDVVVPWEGAFPVRSRNHPAAVALASPLYAANAASNNLIVVASSDLLDWVAVVQADPAAAGVEAPRRCLSVQALGSAPVSPAPAADWAFRPTLDCVVVLSSCLAAALGVVAVVACVAAAAAAGVEAVAVAGAADGTAGIVRAGAVASVVQDSGNGHLGAYCQGAVRSLGRGTAADSCPAAVGTVAVIAQSVDKETASQAPRLAPFCSPQHLVAAAVAAAYAAEAVAGNCPGPDA